VLSPQTTNQFGEQAVGEELVLQKLNFFHPKPVYHPLDWPHGTLSIKNRLNHDFNC
jgi:hypothetical protein